jgi:CRP-like cAMP-binding protein
MPFQRNSAPHLLLDALSESMRAELFAAATEVRYRSGQTIHRRGDRDRSLQVILEGKVSFSRLDTQGRQMSSSVFGPGESFGEIPLLTGRPRTHDAVAVGAVRLLHVSLSNFQNLLTRKPEIRDCLLAELAERLVRAMDQIDSVLRLSVSQRVAQFLLAQMGADEAGPPLVLRQHDIAAALGVTREAVAAALRRFRESGLIETRYRAVKVIDPAALRAEIGEGLAVAAGR